MKPILKIKKLHPDAVIPKYKTEGAAGLDLTAIDMEIRLEPLGVIDNSRGLEETIYNQLYIYKTGLAIEIPKGWKGAIYPRSSIRETSLNLRNCVGIIDSDYRGEVTITFDQHTHTTVGLYKIGDRIAQMVLEESPQFEIQEVEELSETSRGSGGHGSTGR